MKRINWLGRGRSSASAVSAHEPCQTGCAPRRTRLLKLGIFGAIITALCCFTPVLVVLFGVLGLAGLVGYLDYVLFPLLAVFVLLIVVGAVRLSSRPSSASNFND